MEKEQIEGLQPKRKEILQLTMDMFYLTGNFFYFLHILGGDKEITLGEDSLVLEGENCCKTWSKQEKWDLGIDGLVIGIMESIST